MTGLKTELAVGIFVLVVIAMLSFMTFKVTDFEWGARDGYVVYAYFENTSGLDEQTKIRIAGVDAGVIQKIELQDGTAKLTLRMYPSVKLYSDAAAAIKASGILGDKFLSMETGKKEPFLKDGDTIKNIREVVEVDDLMTSVADVSKSINTLVSEINDTIADEEVKQSMKETILNLRDITKALKETIENNDEKLTSILDRVDSLVASLDDLMRTNKQPMTETVSNLNKFSQSLKTDGPELIKNLTKAAEDLKLLLEESRPSLTAFSNKAASTMTALSNITSSLEKGEGTLGKLLKDDRLYVSLTNAATGISNTVSKIERFRTFITFQGEYLTRETDGKGYFYVTLQPRENKYYILGVVADPAGSISVSETTTNGALVREEKRKTSLEFTAQFARRFKDTVLRIGLTESTFGVGADYFLFSDKLKFTADAWDFSEDEYNSRGPHVKAGADYFVFKQVFISGGIDNIFNTKRRGAYIGGGIRFEDEDFKYIFGTVPKIPGQ